MIALHKTQIVKDLPNKALHIKREFEAPLAHVWRAWTDSNLLDQWWAPKPYKAVTKKINFNEGGYWLYYMLGPDGNKMYARFDYKQITPLKQYAGVDCFCDENGTPSTDFPSMSWVNKFIETSGGTLVEIKVSFDSIADMNKIIELGFEEGFTMAHGNLDEVLAV